MAHDPVAILRERFLVAMRAAFGDRLPEDADPLIAAARNPDFGDFQSNAAMPLAKALGEKPRDIAAKIVEQLDLSPIAETLTADSIAGPGFINIRLAPAALGDFLDALDSPDLGIEAPERVETVVVDLCGVNLAKQMHVGHLRSTVIGDALARIFERLGHTVIRQNHFGDWGLPIAMVTERLRALDAEGEVDLDALTLDQLETHYREAQRACDPKQNDPEAAEEALARAKKTLVELQSGEETALAVWRRIYEVTLTECMRTCAALHANVAAEHTAGESTYREELPEIVRDLETRGVAVESKGALVVELEKFGIKEPLLVRKSDGGFLYATTDLAAIRRRVQQLGGDRVIYAVDARQSHHFRQVFAAAHKAGYATRADGATAHLEHAAFGAVLGEDGQPFKTRSGENVKLRDLIDEAVARAGVAVKQKNPSLSEDEQREVAEAVGVGAIKYADLSTERVRDYVFSFNRMLAFEGDTGPYLLYAICRVKSIFRKAQAEFALDASRFEADAPDRPPFRIEAPEEKSLALELLRYPSVIQSAGDALEPHRICAAVYSIATAFSRFFQNCPVLRAPDEETRDARLRLCRLTDRVLWDGLTVLGITPLERM